MGGSTSKLPAWAPPSLRKKDLPANYLELRHPNGSIVHVVGVDELSVAAAADVRRVVRVAKPDSVLLELCDERVPIIWELVETGEVRSDGSIVRRLPELSLSSFRRDARLRRLSFWLVGLELEGYAALIGTTLGAEQAAGAAEAAMLRAQTHHIDRRLSVTFQRTVVAALDMLPVAVAPPPATPLQAAYSEALKGAATLVDDELRSLRAKARAAAGDGRVALALLPEPLRSAVAASVHEHDEILAHRCWECLTGLGPGGVAVAVLDGNRLNGVRDHWSHTDADRVKSLLEPRNLSAVLKATAPLTIGAAIGTFAISRLPKFPRRVIVTSLAVAPAVAAGVVANDLIARYEATRKLQARLASF